MIEELKTRWKAESPEFWIKIKKLSIKIGISATSILGADKFFDLQNYGVPQILFTVCGYIIAACFAFGLSAQITKKDSNDTN